jgi:hypothetical protein
MEKVKMSEEIKNILTGTLLSEENQAAIQSAFDSRVAQAEREIEQKLREEFTVKYKHDRDMLVAAAEELISESLRDVINEIRARREEEAKRVETTISDLEKMVNESLTKELREFSEDRKRTREIVEQFDEMAQEILVEEIAAFRKDRRALVEARIQLANDRRRVLAEARRKWVKEASERARDVITECLRKEMSELRESLVESRKTNFGKKIFEAFRAEFLRSYFSKDAVAAGLVRQLKESKMELAKKEQEIATAKIMQQRALREAREMTEKIKRSEKISSLVQALPPDQRKAMRTILESVPLANMERVFKENLSVVSRTSDKNLLTESTTVSMPRSAQNLLENARSLASSERFVENDPEIEHILRLSGVKR